MNASNGVRVVNLEGRARLLPSRAVSTSCRSVAAVYDRRPFGGPCGHLPALPLFVEGRDACRLGIPPRSRFWRDALRRVRSGSLVGTRRCLVRPLMNNAGWGLTEATLWVIGLPLGEFSAPRGELRAYPKTPGGTHGACTELAECVASVSGGRGSGRADFAGFGIGSKFEFRSFF